MRVWVKLWVGLSEKHHSLTAFRMNGGDDGTRTRGLCRDSLGIHVLSATYVLSGVPSR
jgi:hypothetical protein